jgi:hypothetical protein
MLRVEPHQAYHDLPQLMPPRCRLAKQHVLEDWPGSKRVAKQAILKSVRLSKLKIYSAFVYRL